MAKRKPGRLFSLEFDVLDSGLALQAADGSFYGFALAREISDRSQSTLTAHGTLYKVLGRMRDAGMLDARWEDSAIADAANRPRRRLYTVTGLGEKAYRAESRLRAEMSLPPVRIAQPILPLIGFARVTNRLGGATS